MGRSLRNRNWVGATGTEAAAAKSRRGDRGRGRRGGPVAIGPAVVELAELVPFPVAELVPFPVADLERLYRIGLDRGHDAAR
jgi:hypothetical protein